MNLVECNKCKKFVDDERCTKIAVLENCKYKHYKLCESCKEKFDIWISEKISSTQGKKGRLSIWKKTKNGLMECSRCGYSTSVASLFCKNCGAKIVNKHSEV